MKKFTKFLLVAAASTAALSANADGFDGRLTWKLNDNSVKFKVGAQASAATMADFYNNDYLDVLYGGCGSMDYYNHPGVWVWQASSNILKNNGDGTYDESIIEVEGTGEWQQDENGEERYDDQGNLIVDDEGNPIKFKEIYRYTGSKHGIVPVVYPHYATIDYNNDGLVDLLLMGVLGPNDNTNAKDLVPDANKADIGDGQVIVTILYKNLGNGAFEMVENTNLPVVCADRNSNGKESCFMRPVAWGDFDRDGYVDIAFSGIIKTNEPGEPGRVAQIWRNIDGTGKFEQMNIAETIGGTWTNEVKHTEGEGDEAQEIIDIKSRELEGWFILCSGNVTVGDINNDGWLDIIFTGWCDKISDPIYASQKNSGSYGRVYLNQEGKKFIDITDRYGQFIVSRDGSSNLADFDGDGYLDFLTVGYSDVSGWWKAIFYNEGEGSESVFSAPEAPEGMGCDDRVRVDIRDFDGDGSLDLFWNGRDDSRILYGDNTGTFTRTDNNLPIRGNEGHDGIAVPGDLTGNGLSDRFETGWQWVHGNYDGVNYRELLGSGDWTFGRYIWENTTPVEIVAPEAPADVKGSIDPDTHMITVEWTDIEDLTCAYNVVVVTPSGKVISNLPVNPETGFVKVSENKNIAVRPFVQKYSVPAKEVGDYKVGVQAVSLYNEKNSPIVWYDKVLSGVRDIFTDNTSNLIVSVNGNDITVNTSATTDVKIVDMMGRTVATGVTNTPINVAANGVFIITANGKSAKVVK